jgi:hypothetical protein
MARKDMDNQVILKAITHGNLLRMKSCTHSPVDPEPYVTRAVDNARKRKFVDE